MFDEFAQSQKIEPRYMEVARAFKTGKKMSIVENRNKNRLKPAKNGDIVVTSTGDNINNSNFSITPKHYISSGTSDYVSFSSPLDQYQRVSEIRKQQGMPPMNADEKRLLMLQLKYQEQSKLEDRKSQLRQGEGLRQDVFKVMRATLPIFYGK
jgi:hypothetical protein